MKIEKDKLIFLNIFKTLSDTKSDLGNKLQIKVKEGIAIFSMVTGEVRLLTVIEVDSKEEFTVLVPIYDLTGYLAIDSDFEITEQGLVYEKDKEIYEFENHELDFPDEVISITKDLNYTEYTIKDINKALIAKKYKGVDDLDAVALMDNHFVSTDRLLCSIIKSKNEIDHVLYLPNKILELFSEYQRTVEDFNQVDIKLFKDFWTFELDNVEILVPIQEYSIPEVFDPDYILEYEHPNKVILNKKELSLYLRKMQIASQNNPNNRIFINVNSGNLLIRSEDYKKSIATIKVDSIDDALQGSEIIVSCNYLIKLLDSLTGEKVIFYISIDPEKSSTVKIEDEKHDKKLIHVLYENDTDE